MHELSYLWKIPGYLLRWYYPEIRVQIPDCIIISGAGNRPNGRPSLEGEYLLDELLEWAMENPTWVKSTTVLFVSGNTFFGEETTEAEALLRRLNGLLATRPDIKFGALVCLDPPDRKVGEVMEEWFRLAESQPSWPLNVPSRNTYQGMLKALDYCRCNGFTKIVSLAHPLHQTWAWPLMIAASRQCPSGRSRFFGRINSYQRWWHFDPRAPQWRLKAFPLFYAWGILSKGAMLLRGWIDPETV